MSRTQLIMTSHNKSQDNLNLNEKRQSTDTNTKWHRCWHYSKRILKQLSWNTSMSNYKCAWQKWRKSQETNGKYKEQMEFLELKITKTRIKSLLDWFNNGMERTQERISEVTDRTTHILQSEKQKENRLIKKTSSASETCRSINKIFSIHVCGVPEREQKG